MRASAPFDRVLCDVPCSGLGIIRRKPELKYKPVAEFEGLPGVQYGILHRLCPAGKARRCAGLFHLHPQPEGKRRGDPALPGEHPEFEPVCSDERRRIFPHSAA